MTFKIWECIDPSVILFCDCLNLVRIHWIEGATVTVSSCTKFRSFFFLRDESTEQRSKEAKINEKRPELLDRKWGTIQPILLTSFMLTSPISQFRFKIEDIRNLKEVKNILNLPTTAKIKRRHTEELDQGVFIVQKWSIYKESIPQNQWHPPTAQTRVPNWQIISVR